LLNKNKNKMPVKIKNVSTARIMSNMIGLSNFAEYLDDVEMPHFKDLYEYTEYIKNIESSETNILKLGIFTLSAEDFIKFFAEFDTIKKSKIEKILVELSKIFSNFTLSELEPYFTNLFLAFKTYFNFDIIENRKTHFDYAMCIVVYDNHKFFEKCFDCKIVILSDERDDNTVLLNRAMKHRDTEHLYLYINTDKIASTDSYKPFIVFKNEKVLSKVIAYIVDELYLLGYVYSEKIVKNLTIYSWYLCEHFKDDMRALTFKISKETKAIKNSMDINIHATKIRIVDGVEIQYEFNKTYTSNISGDTNDLQDIIKNDLYAFSASCNSLYEKNN
jgi:hypothetical protein